VKVYKFRSLANAEAYKWTMDIITTGAFWHARFWTMNDPMEGLYSRLAKDTAGSETLYPHKAKLLICSFSESGALSSPAMWGYYAGGFKGIALEVEVADSAPGAVEYIKKVEYRKVPFALGEVEPGTDAAQRVLCRKLDAWKHEREWRSIVECEHLPEGITGKAIRMGTITGIYVGDPLRNIGNREEICQNAPEWATYAERARQVVAAAREAGTRGTRIEVRAARIKGGKVEFVPYDGVAG
jgi:hypothetical protein